MYKLYNELKLITGESLMVVIRLSESMELKKIIRN